MTRSTLSATTYRGMRPSDITMLRGMLDEQRNFRIEQLHQLCTPGQDTPLSITEPEILRELVAGARAALHEVQAALWRIDAGTYGRCTGCGGPLEMHRLEILPAVATCLRCRRGAEEA